MDAAQMVSKVPDQCAVPRAGLNVSRASLDDAEERYNSGIRRGVEVPRRTVEGTTLTHAYFAGDFATRKAFQGGRDAARRLSGTSIRCIHAQEPLSGSARQPSDAGIGST